MRSTGSRRRLAGLAACAALAATTVACGSDSGDESGSGGSGKDPIKVMVFGPLDAKGFSIKGVETGAQAGVDKVNEEGGIGGRELELIACNDNNDPNTAAGCARQAVQEKVVAVIGSLSLFEPQILPVLQEAKIPAIGLTAISTFDNPIEYPVSGGAPGAVFALGKQLVAAPECSGTVGGVVEDMPAIEAAASLMGLAVQAVGGEFTGFSKFATGSADFAPAISAATEKATCLGYFAGPSTAPSLLQAITTGGQAVKFGATESIVPNEALQVLGEAGDGTLAYSSYLPLNETTDTPEMKEFLERGQKLDEDFAPEQGAASGYLGALILQRALDGVDVSELTSTDVIKALDSFAGYDTGLGPTVDFAAVNPTKAFSRMPYSTPSYEWVAKGGRYELGAPDPISISEIYDAASAAGQ